MKMYRVYGYESAKWAAYFYHNGFAIQFGFHLDLTLPNIEIHVPFGFFRIGIRHEWRRYGPEYANRMRIKDWHGRPRAEW